jgi:hypothetical protein
VLAPDFSMRAVLEVGFYVIDQAGWSSTNSARVVPMRIRKHEPNERFFVGLSSEFREVRPQDWRAGK